MISFTLCFFLLVGFFLAAIKVKNYLASKKSVCLEDEIENDLIEEFPALDNSEDFLNWAEGLHLEREISKRK